MARHLLVVLSNAVEGRDDEYNDWYTNHHLDEILEIEGFKRGQRFELADARMTRDTPDTPYHYLAVYEIEEDALERADAALFHLARTERAAAQAAGRTPQLVLSPAMDKELRTWWFRSISDVREASE
jgi:hypothetical protein